MSRITVLEDGPFTIQWNGGHTYNVVLFGEDINVFSSDYGTQESEAEAREHAHEWWKSYGKEDTQQVIRETRG